MEGDGGGGVHIEGSMPTIIEHPILWTCAIILLFLVWAICCICCLDCCMGESPLPT